MTPTTGPLARFGRESATALTLWVDLAAALPAPWTGVDLGFDEICVRNVRRNQEEFIGAYGERVIPKLR